MTDRWARRPGDHHFTAGEQSRCARTRTCELRHRSYIRSPEVECEELPVRIRRRRWAHFVCELRRSLKTHGELTRCASQWDFSAAELQRPRHVPNSVHRMSIASTASLGQRNGEEAKEQRSTFHPAPSLSEVAMIQPVMVCLRFGWTNAQLTDTRFPRTNSSRQPSSIKSPFSPIQ